MKIITKNYGLTDNKEPKYLVYLSNDDNTPIECYDVVGDVEKEKRIDEFFERFGVLEQDFVSIEELYKENNVEADNEEVTNLSHPMVLVFYIDRAMLGDGELFAPYYQSIRDYVSSEKSKIAVFFLPTDDQERIECINPAIVSAQKMDEINSMVVEIAKKFDIIHNLNIEDSPSV